MESGRRNSLLRFKLVLVILAVTVAAMLTIDPALTYQTTNNRHSSWGQWLGSPFSPGGIFGSYRKWKQEWTQEFKKCFDQHGQTLASRLPQDAEEYCSQNVVESQRWKFYLSIFMPLAEKESGFNEKAKGQNGGRVPQGLYQMDEQDMRSHKCEGQDPLDAKQNICCAIKIADNQAKKAQGNPRIANSNKGIMDAFWQPMREGMGGDGRGNNASVNNSKNHGDIKTKAKELCGMNLGSGNRGGDDFTTDRSSWR